MYYTTVMLHILPLLFYCKEQIFFSFRSCIKKIHCNRINTQRDISLNTLTLRMDFVAVVSSTLINPQSYKHVIIHVFITGKRSFSQFYINFIDLTDGREDAGAELIYLTLSNITC